MTQTINLFVVGGDKLTSDRMLALTRGSRIGIVGSGSIGAQTLRNIAVLRPRVCLIHARLAEDDYLAFARSILAECPTTKVLLFGPSDDPEVMARAAASKVWNYLPEYITYPDFVQAVTDAAEGIPAAATSPLGQARDALPRPRGDLQPHALPALVRQCLTVGLAADDISRHLDTDIETIRGHIARIRRHSASPSPLWRRIAYVGLALAALAGVSTAVKMTWSLGSRRIAVSGRVGLDSQPLDYGAIEFRSLTSPTAVVSGAVIQDGTYRIPAKKGLMPGEYVVLISAPETPPDRSRASAQPAAPPAKERIPESYNTASTLRVDVRRLGNNVFDFDVKSPDRKQTGAGDALRE